MFKPGSVWKDTAGKPIQAHGAGLLHHNGRYYWFGQYMDAPTIATSFLNRCDVVGISCYSSDDLYHWHDEGLVLHAVPGSPPHDLHPSNVVERPKVIFNEKTGMFVMWLHIDHSDYTFARVGVAVSDKATGPYTYFGSFNPCAQTAAI
jgi:hypothetical protein